MGEVIDVFLPNRALDGPELVAFYTDRGATARADMRVYLQRTKITRVPVKMLFTGHTGSGKSSELNKLAEELGDTFFTVKVNTRSIVAPIELTITDVVLIAAMALFKAATDSRLIEKAPAQVVEGVWLSISELIDRTIFGKVPYHKSIPVAETGAKVSVAPVVNALTLEFEARFKDEASTRSQIREQMKDRLSEVIAKTNLLAGEIQHKYGKPVLFLFDDTDKPENDVARKIFFDHPQTLTAFNASVIYSFPISLWYSTSFSDFKQYFAHHFRLPNAALVSKNGQANPEAREFLDHLLARRTQSSLIDPKAREYIIHFSGGLTRNLIELTQFSAVRALGRGSDKIELRDAEKAVQELQKDFTASLLAEHYPVLAQRHIDKRLSSDKTIQELLESRALLEYENGATWCDVHPAALPLVLERISTGVDSST